jgi:multidrug efflux system outer membrane protein
VHSIRRTWISAPALLLILLFAGCALGPNYHRPPVDTPGQFRGSSVAGTNSIAELPWWEMFKDETLQRLIQGALTNNYDLLRAISRVEQARAIAAQNRALFFPQINYQAEVARGKNALGNTPVSTGGQTVNAFLLGGNTAWELDVWGRIRRLNEAARAQYLAQEDARRGVLITVISDVATAYYQLLTLDWELDIARRSTNAFSQSLGIFSERLQGGIASRLETSAAEAALASAAANVPELERQIVLQENQLSVLLGRNPGQIARQHTLLQQRLPPEIPAGLPSALLARRPDVRAAEQQLRAANAQVGAAVASFLPQISLTGFFGQVSPELSALTAGGANAWSIAAPLTGPLFQGGRLVARYRETEAAREEARLAYRATILTALQEASNAIISEQKFTEARVQHARAVDAYTVAVQVATQRYITGRGGYYEVLQEQQLLFPAENALAETELNQFLSLIQLYRALGGGWIWSEYPQPGFDRPAAGFRINPPDLKVD